MPTPKRSKKVWTSVKTIKISLPHHLWTYLIPPYADILRTSKSSVTDITTFHKSLGMKAFFHMDIVFIQNGMQVSCDKRVGTVEWIDFWILYPIHSAVHIWPTPTCKSHKDMSERRIWIKWWCFEIYFTKNCIEWLD